MAVGLGMAMGMVGTFFLWNRATPVAPAGGSNTTGTAGATSTSTAPPSTVVRPVKSASLFVIWTSGGLPDGLAEGVREIAGVETVSMIRSDLVLIVSVFDALGTVVEEPPDGWFLPLEAAAIDDQFASLVPNEWQAYLSGLSTTDVILSETSADIRRITVGATLVAGGAILRVNSVLPDVVVGGAELVVTSEGGETIGVNTPRYLLIAYAGERAVLEDAVRSILPPEAPVRIRALGETPFLRHGDAVLPQVLIKEAFGEFTIRPTSTGGFEIDQEWADRHIFSTELPLIGEASCHAAITTPLTAALVEIERSNLGFVVESFDGCFYPRFIAGSRSLSRHAWGAAIDLNYAANPTGQVTVQDPRLVSIMENWGFTWGGNWLVPDAAHFEWVGPPVP